MKPEWHQRLIVRIGAGVLLAEIIGLAVTGWWFVRTFNDRLDRELAGRLTLPGAIMSKDFLDPGAATDGVVWRNLFGEEVVEALVFDSTGRVKQSMRPEQLNQSAFEITGLSEAGLGQLPEAGRIISITEQGDPFAACVFRVKPATGQAAALFLYAKVGTAAAVAEKGVVAWRFVLGGIATVGLTAFMLMGLYRRQLGEGLKQMIDAAGQVGRGQIGARIVMGHAGSELGVLARQVNEMLDTLERRERELSELTRFQRAILDQAAYAIIATDARGIITAFNRTAERMLGFEAAELLGRQTPAVFHDFAEVRERAAAFSSELGERIEPGFDTFVCRTRHGLPNEQEWTYVRKDGVRFPVMLGITALGDGAGATTGYLGIAMDLRHRRQAEIELRRSRSQLEAAQRLARLGSWEFELASGSLHWSQEMYQLYGRQPSLGPPSVEEFYELIHPEDRPLIRKLNDQATGLQETATCDFRTNPALGRMKFLSAQIFCLRDAQGSPVSVGGTIQDITDRKLGELALREGEERSRLVINALVEGVIVMDNEGKITVGNQSAESILGLTHQQLIGHGGTSLRDGSRWQTIHEDGRPFPREQHPSIQTLKTGQPVRGVVMGIRKDNGSVTWLSINTAPLTRAGESQPYAVVSSFFDITEQRAAVKASQERARLAELDAGVSRSLGGSKPLPETLAECVRQIVSLLDAAMCRVWLMAADQETLLLAATEGFDMSLAGPFASIPVGKLKVGKIAAEQQPLLANDLATRPDLDVSDWERREGVTAFAGFPLIADGRLLGVIGVFSRRPISDEAYRSLGRLADRLSLGILRKQGEEQIQRLNAELERRVAERTAELGRRVSEVETLNRSMINLLEDLQQARDDAERSTRQIEVANSRLRTANEELESFSYSVSHDLRAPLRNVSGFVDLLRKKLEGSLDDSPARYMKIIQDETQRMARLIDDLLEFSRLGRARIRTEQFSMAALVAEVREELRPVASPEIEWFTESLPDCACDRSLIRQVWVNLLSNAVKYSRHSRPARVTVGAVPAAPGSREVAYFVQDNGVGFDMKYVDKLFGVFQRLHSAGEFEGTGIGLANVQRIVSRHGGRVWAEGTVGQGATFYFALPVAGA